MEEQSIYTQTPQQPEMSPTPAPHSHMPMMVLIGVVMLGIGLVGGYFLFANKNPQTSRVNNQQVAEVLPTVAKVNTPEPIVDPSDSSLVFNSPTINGLGYTLKYPYNWSARVWGGGGENPMPLELAYEFVSKEDSKLNVTVKHFMSANPKEEIKIATDSLTNEGFTLRKELNNNNIELTKISGNVGNETDFYAFIVSPKGYYIIFTRDGSESHRGIAFDYILANFALTK